MKKKLGKICKSIYKILPRGYRFCGDINCKQHTGAGCFNQDESLECL